MNSEFLTALNEIEKEKNISKDLILDAIDAALVSAYKRNYNTNQNNVLVNIDRESGEVKVFVCKEVVEEVQDSLCQISLDDAKNISGTYEIGDVVNIEDTPAAFGRIAAQTAKQVVLQRIKEAERNLIYDEFSEKEHKVVVGTIQRIEKRNIYLDIGKTEAYLAPGEQVSTESYNFHQRLKVYVTEVRKTTKGPVVNVSRTRPALVAKLFAEEIPEIADGVVEVKSVSREAGSRTKIAVWSNDKNVDPIGACIGAKGTRVQNLWMNWAVKKLTSYATAKILQNLSVQVLILQKLYLWKLTPKKKKHMLLCLIINFLLQSAKKARMHVLPQDSQDIKSTSKAMPNKAG